MRVLFLSDELTILLCFIVWPIIQSGCALLMLNLPKRLFHPDHWVYRSHAFEKEGELYQTLFKVKSWKHLLPDGGAVWRKKGYQKKHLEDYRDENLEKFLVESCRGEATHIGPILLFWIFFLFTPFYVGWMMLVYSLIVNMPCIIVQRYNRPRIKHLLEKHPNRQYKKVG
jgi:glycosyl-4,4'-diaponeurosporenoate acyltransferase